jgi:GNAT superfamily N-acetyltransferase
VGKTCSSFIAAAAGVGGELVKQIMWKMRAAAFTAAAACVALGCALERSRRRRRRARGTLLQTADCVVRWATSADVATILRMIKGLAEFEQYLEDVMITEDMLRRDLEEGYYECLLADQTSGSCVGFALFCNRYSTSRGRCMYLQDLFVIPETRGCGVGQLLIQAVARIAVSRVCASVYWCALGWNTSAIAFYESSHVGARERLADEAGTKYVNFALTGSDLDRLAARSSGDSRCLCDHREG